jgi:Putative peptidoglycan binding domain
MSDRPTLRDGSYGADVGVVQGCLGIDADLDFGPQTEAAVRDYQTGHNLSPVDGVVGSTTWDAFEGEFPLPAYPPPLVELSSAVVAEISQIARNSAVAGYAWQDRGVAPAGYINGMAVAYVVALTRLREREPMAEEMARAETGDSDNDALAWFAPEFATLGMSNEHPGVATLRHLFVLLIGLGMRESSGAYCEGRDMSASNVSADTAEAGLFQMSWNASAASTSILALFDAYQKDGDAETGYESVFNEDVSCSESDWENYGSGDGATYQYMAKRFPAFAVETAAIGVRALRQHWGPINRKEVELRREADDMLKAVEKFAAEIEPPRPEPPQPEPEVSTVRITVDPPGSARVIVEGSA